MTFAVFFFCLSPVIIRTDGAEQTLKRFSCQVLLPWNFYNKCSFVVPLVKIQFNNVNDAHRVYFIDQFWSNCNTHWRAISIFCPFLYLRYLLAPSISLCVFVLPRNCLVENNTSTPPPIRSIQLITTPLPVIFPGDTSRGTTSAFGFSSPPR